MSMTQPIITYKIVESRTFDPIEMAFITAPIIAQVQTIPNTVQPTHPRKAVKQKGVYVPAINK